MDELREHFEDLLESDQNDPQVQFEIGQCYREGRGVEKDTRLAEKWLTRAAQQGHQEAKRLLEAGKAPKKTVDQEVTAENLPRWCVRAEDGDPDAQYKVAVYLKSSKTPGAEKDIQRYLTSAAEQGHPDACLELGRELRRRGWNAQAVEYLRNAADCGEPAAMQELARCYAKGTGVLQDWEKAELYYCKAAELSNADAKLDLAVRFALGTGVKKSRVKALSWVQKAEDDGMADAQERFEKEFAKQERQLAVQRRRQAEDAQAKNARRQKKAAEQARRRAEAQRAAQEADRKRKEEKERQREQADAEKFKDWDRWMPPVLAVFTWLSASIPLGYGLTMTRIPFLRQMAARVLIPPVLWWLRWNEESLMWALYALIFFVGAKIVETGNKRADVSRSKFLAWFQWHGVLLYILIFCVSLAYLTYMAFALK